MGQTFKACTDGEIISVSIGFRHGSNGTFDLFLEEEPGPNNNLTNKVATLTIPSGIGSNQVRTFNLAIPYPVLNDGTVYRLAVQKNPSGTFNMALRDNEPGDYPDGVYVASGGAYVNSKDLDFGMVINATPKITATNDGEICLGDVAVLDAGAPCNAPHSYQWSTGETSKIININPSSNATYTVTITDGDSSTGTASIEITVHTPPTASAETLAAVCADGSLVPLSVSTNANSPSYLWSNGGTNTTTAISNPVNNAVHTVTVTDGTTGCTQTAMTTLTVFPLPAIVASGDEICLNGTAQLSAAGGVSYAWSGNALSNSTVSSPTVTGLSEGIHIYTVSVTSSNMCVNTETVEITVHPLPTLQAVTTAVCANGTASLSVISNAASPIYTWSNGGSATMTSVNNPVDGAVYTVTVTDGTTNCQQTATVALTVHPLAATPTIQSIEVQGQSGAQDADFLVCGNDANNQYAFTTSTTYASYQWGCLDGNGCPSLGTNQQTDPITNTGFFEPGVNNQDLATFEYGVTVTDDNGCTATATVTQSIAYLPLPTATVDRSGILCGDEQATLTDIGPKRATGTYNYVWSNGANTQSIQTNTAGDYTVTVTNEYACSGTSIITVAVTQVSLLEAIATSNSAICSGEDLNLMETGGNATTWSWSGPNNFSSNVQNPTIQNATTAANGDYFVTVTNAGNCTGVSSVSVTVNPSAIAMATSNSEICAGENLNLMETGTGAIAWSWSGPNNFSSNIQNPTIQNSTTATSGNYFVTVTNSDNCTGTSSTFVTVHPLPNPEFNNNTLNNNLELCAGASDIVYRLSNNFDKYEWSIVNGVATNNPTNGGGGMGRNRARVDWNTTAGIGNVFVTVTNSQGCTATSSLEVTLHPNPIAAPMSNTPICAEEDLNLSETGGTANAWLWSGPNNFNSTEQSPTITAATTAANGTYFVTVTNSDNCTTTSSISAIVYATPNVNVSNESPICAGEDLALMETAGDATAWLWRGPNNFSSTAQNPTLTAATTAANGVYFVTVTTSDNCTATANTFATVHPTPNLTISNNAPICAGEDLMLMETAGEATTWYWRGPNNFTSVAQNPIIANATTAANGTYFVTVTNSENCTAMGSTVAIVYPTPVPIITGTFDFCLGRMASLDAGAYDDLPNTYQWSNGAISQVIDTNTAGTYTVTVTNSSACTGTASVEVTALPCFADAGTLTTNADSICPGEDVIASVADEQQGANYNQKYFLYAESNIGVTTYIAQNSTGIFSDLATGDYLVCAYNECLDCPPSPSPLTTNLDDINSTGTTQNGCFDFDCQNITVSEAFNPVEGSVSTFSTSTGSLVFVVEVCGGVQPYDEDLSSSGGFVSVSELPSANPGCSNYQVLYANGTDWTLTITDANGCSGSGLIYTSDGAQTVPQPQIDDIIMTQETCAGVKDGELSLVIDHGDNSCNTYTAIWAGPNYNNTVTFDASTLPATTTITGLASGTYNVTVSDCADTSITSDFYLSRSGEGCGGGRGGRGGRGKADASDLGLIDFALFPNPLTEESQLRFGLTEEALVEIAIYTIEGKKLQILKKEWVSANENQSLAIPARLFPSGMYILQLSTNTGIIHYERMVIR